MKKIILARHTESKLIASGILEQKRNDSPLSDFGLEQATEMRKFINERKLTYEIIFTSLFQRARHTAEIINQDFRAKTINCGLFGEYFIQDDGVGIETTNMAISRVMPKIYSLFDQYDNMLLVAHSSINKTIIQNILNCTYSESLKYFNNTGEIHVLRYDHTLGDENWTLIDSFVPKQR